MKRFCWLFFIFCLFIAGCGGSNDKENSTRVEYVEVQSTSNISNEIAAVVAEENDYRASVGQAQISNGLTCSLYGAVTGNPDGIPGTPARAPLTGTVGGALGSVTTSWAYFGVFNNTNTPASDGINILPAAIRSSYTQWYVVRCTGYIVITDTDYYNYTLTSDDGSLLYLDNVLVVNNNGTHGSEPRSGMRMMRRGVHQFRLDYLQGPAGGQSLILEQNGIGVVPANVFYR